LNTLPGNFFTHDDYERHRQRYADLMGPNGWLLFVACDAGKTLAQKVHQAYQQVLQQKYFGSNPIEIPLMQDITKRFEGDGHDGTSPRIPKHVAGADVYLFQSVMDERTKSEGVNEGVWQIGQVAFTLKAHRVNRVTAVLPYFPYSRQDKPSHKEREAALARHTADYLVNSGVDCVISYHPHTTAIVGFFPHDKPFQYISGIDLFTDVFSQFRKDPETIALSLDAGGLKETIHLAGALDIDFGLTAKDRPKQKQTKTLGVLGNLDGKKRGILTDDETATFGSCLDAIKLLAQPEYGIHEFHVGISHMRLGLEFIDRLREAHEKYGMVKLHTTDTVPQKEEILSLPFVEVHSLSNMWAYVINHVHYDLSVSKLFGANGEQ
jgi:ribose-phosphate pyrophosphokinase